MCDAPVAAIARGWVGWGRPGPAEPGFATSPAGPWVDLSWPLSPTTPRLPAFPPPLIERIATIDANRMNISRIEINVHVGTHIDSPRHFYEDGPAFQDIPPDRLAGQGVVWRIEPPADGVIEPEDLAAAGPAVQAGDIVVLDTGAQTRFASGDSLHHPHLSQAAARWLVERGVKLLAVDNPTPDAPLDRRGPGFDWPVHRTLLEAGVLIAEQVTNLAGLAGRRVELVFGAINIVDCDGAPARVMARPLADLDPPAGSASSSGDRV